MVLLEVLQIPRPHTFIVWKKSNGEEREVIWVWNEIVSKWSQPAKMEQTTSSTTKSESESLQKWSAYFTHIYRHLSTKTLPYALFLLKIDRTVTNLTYVKKCFTCLKTSIIWYAPKLNELVINTHKSMAIYTPSQYHMNTATLKVQLLCYLCF